MNDIYHRYIEKEDFKVLLLEYKPYIIQDKYYVIKENYCNKNGAVSKYFINRYPISEDLIKEKDNYELLFFILDDENLVTVQQLKDGIFNYVQTGQEAKLLYRLTNQLILFWVKRNSHCDQIANEYLAKVNNAIVTNHAQEVLQRFNHYKYGISNLYLPGQISILATNKCNAECIHCYRRNHIIKPECLTNDKFLALLEDAYSNGITSVNLLGGEPLIRDDILSIIKKCQDLKLLLKITTNGIKLADEEFVKSVAGLFDNTLSFFQISIDGIGEMQDQIRKNASWDLMLKAFDNLTKYSLRWKINTVLTKPLYKQLELYYQTMSAIHVPCIRFTMLKQCGEGNQYNDLVLTPKEVDEAIKKINDLSNMYGVKTINGLRNPIFVLQDEPSKYMDLPYQSCNAMNYQLTIGYNLQYLPCEFYEPFDSAWGESFNDIKIKDFWHNSKFAEKFRHIEIEGKCRDCHYNLYCSKGCPVETLYLTGSINKSNPLCWYKPNESRSNQLDLPDYVYIDEVVRDE